ncbi:MAG TPA: NAD(P)/FAD-dependent oxidoreductase [Dehalococcoidia bacterium]|nr:NAD(P)/FAD-dependent oxidoreductase [Dehalococcoidia bacterium]
MYDAIVVGARCAGSPTAMLLARKGYRVLLMDKDSFPSDTMSTLAIWPHGAEALDRWGLYDKLAETGCPPTALKMRFDVGPFALVGGVTITNGGRGGFCPRRTVLDKLLVDAATESGAELRENFTVESLLWENDRVVGIRGHERNGSPVEERARIVIGADGVHSFVAKAVDAPEYNAVPPLATYFYSYFSGIDADDVEQYTLESEGAAYFPTHDGLTIVATVWKAHRFKEIREDIEGNVMRVHRKIPELAERLEGARREEPWVGTAGIPNMFRRPYGPGWALVGDAGYVKDPLTGQGINDGFIDAENLADAIDAGFAGRQPLDDAMANYETSRNERVTPMFHFTCELASLEPPPPEMQQLFAAMHGNQEATDQFYSAITGSLPLPQFMDPENIGRIMSRAAMSA